MQQRHNIEVVQGGWRREEYAKRNKCCATDLCNPAQSASTGTSAPKPVSATTAAKGSAGSSTFTVLLTMACCFATFFS